MVEILSDDDYKKHLNEKLNEELMEYQENRETEELVVLLEVIHATAKSRGISVDELEQYSHV